MLETDSVVRPGDECSSPLDRPDWALARVQRHLLVPEPSLLVQYERSGHTARDELARAPLAKVGLERDTPHRAAQVEDVVLRAVKGLDRHLA